MKITLNRSVLVLSWPCFAYLRGSDDCQILLDIAEYRRVEAGTKVISLSQTMEHIAIISKGEVAVCAAGEVVESLRLRMGSLFGEMEFFNPSRCMANVIARVPTEVVLLPYTKLKSLMDERPDIGMRLCQGFLKVLAEKKALVTDSLNQWKIDRSVKHVAHALAAPIASLEGLTPSLSELSHDQMVLFQKTLSRMKHIASSLSEPPANQPEIEPVSLFLIAERARVVLEEKKAQFAYKGEVSLTLHQSIEDKSVHIACKIISLERVLSNLLDGAYEAVSPGGKICVRLKAHSDMVTIEVEDDGKDGPKYLLGLLENRHDGMHRYGFGIAYVTQTVKKWHGQFSVGSGSSGGTVVSMTFPQVEAMGAASTEEYLPTL